MGAHIGSLLEAKPHPDILIYSASKAVRSYMVYSLFLQLTANGITINNVVPGVIYTDRNVESTSDLAYAKMVIDSIPVGFYGDRRSAPTFSVCSAPSRGVTSPGKLFI